MLFVAESLQVIAFLMLPRLGTLAVTPAPVPSKFAILALMLFFDMHLKSLAFCALF
jgi:hypothetical protein